MLSRDEQTRWNAAVRFVADVELPNEVGIDSSMKTISNPLAAAAPNGDLEDVALEPRLAAVLREAMPIYRRAWWPAHDARNRQWISSMEAQLGGRERCLAERAQELFRASWPATDIRVDATVYASWFGAYSTHRPTHITVSANARGTQDSEGLEVLIHETAHGMLGPLDLALAAEGVRQRKTIPRELSHLVLFYTAGALVKELVPDHRPFAETFGIWRQNETAQAYRRILDQQWRPYISGSVSFCEAIAAVVRELQ
jgi:hypothetical protein